MRHFAILLILAVVSACQSSTPIPIKPVTDDSVDRPRFPRVLDLGTSVLTLHEPQLESHKGYREVTVWTAAVHQPKSGGKRTIGALKISADMIANFEDRTVTLYNRRIDESYFPELTEQEKADLIRKIKEVARNEPETMPLDVVLAYLASGEAARKKAANISMDPPKILYSDRPAFLVQFGGDPVFHPLVANGPVAYAANTNWDLFRTPAGYSLLLGQSWVSAKSLNGPWSPGQAPATISELPTTDRFASARRAIPGKPLAGADVPRIYVMTKPAELIVTDGPPKLENIGGTSLAFVANTSRDIAFDRTTKTYYFLVSGRWFKASNLAGPWSSVDALPADFAIIPPGHPRGHVRAAIPGTDEAKTALVEASIPKTAAVPRSLAPPEVLYSGRPTFEPIAGTGVARAVNTPFDVLKVGNRYYLCHEAVWFESDSANGPWVVADRVPDAIYTIPSSSPAYHVTFVRVYDTGADNVLVGYTGGYQSIYIVEQTVVYGSGYYSPPFWVLYPWYDPWDWHDDYWYWYHPYPNTYGSASSYNPVTGTYRHGDYVYGPYGGYGSGGSYNERTGRRSESEFAWDYNSGEYHSKAYNPTRGTTFETRQNYRYDSPNSYESWGESTITKGDDWIKTKRYSNPDGRTFSYETSMGGQGGRAVTGDGSLAIGKTGDGDLYAGRNGQVYRRAEDGSWQKREDGNWSALDPALLGPSTDSSRNQTPAHRDYSAIPWPEGRQGTPWSEDSSIGRGSYGQLDRSYRARTQGNARYQNFQLYRGGGGRRR